MFDTRSPHPWPRRRPTAPFAVVAVLLVLVVGGCMPLFPSRGGGQAEFEGPRTVDPAGVALPEGYRIEVVAEGLTFPTGIAFDGEGVPHVVESGYAYGEVVATPRLSRIEADGSRTTVAEGDNPPWNGVAHADGSFFVAGGTFRGGEILRITPEGEVSSIVGGLPSIGDHHTNGPVVGRDGWIYFGQGTATNSGVVGPDNADFGWLHRYPEFHDVACRELTLNGTNFLSENPLSPEGGEVLTGPYQPFGTPAHEGQVVEGELPCNGAVLRVHPERGDLELVAWGLRNPFGLAWAPDGELYVVENSFDVRGSRPVFGSGDVLWRIEEGRWYGWPDFHADRPLSWSEQYAAPGHPPPGLVLLDPPELPPPPVALLGVHSSSNGMDFSRNGDFGFEGHAFIAQFGDLAPEVGKVMGPVGFRVVRVDVEDGVVHDFAVNRDPNGPASRTGTAGLERPVAVRFAPDGSSLYVVDFGVMTVGEHGPLPRPGTGVIWRIVPEGSR